jgi:hypothetical protein
MSWIRKVSSRKMSSRTQRTIDKELGAEILDVQQGHPASRFADSQPPMSSTIAASKTPWWRSTSVVVVTGDISAMLWNGVSMMPRFNR